MTPKPAVERADQDLRADSYASPALVESTSPSLRAADIHVGLDGQLGGSAAPRAAVKGWYWKRSGRSACE